MVVVVSNTFSLLTFFLLLLFDLGQVVLVRLGTLRRDAVQPCSGAAQSSQGLSRVSTVHRLVDGLDGLSDCRCKHIISTQSTSHCPGIQYTVGVYRRSVFLHWMASCVSWFAFRIAS